MQHFNPVAVADDAHNMRIIIQGIMSIGACGYRNALSSYT